MTLTTKLVRKRLTQKEQRHLTESGIRSVAAMERQIAYQKADNPEHPGSSCHECWAIARKLGMID